MEPPLCVCVWIINTNYVIHRHAKHLLARYSIRNWGMKKWSNYLLWKVNNIHIVNVDEISLFFNLKFYSIVEVNGHTHSQHYYFLAAVIINRHRNGNSFFFNTYKHVYKKHFNNIKWNRYCWKGDYLINKDIGTLHMFAWFNISHIMSM